MMTRLFFVPQPAPSAATVGAAAALLAAFVLAFRHAHPSSLSLALGLALITGGIAIRLITNAMLRKNELVCREGLYAVCRHPMYAGTIIAAAGIAIALNDPPAVVLVAIAVAISLYRIRREEAHLTAALPGYAEYQREVPAFPTPASVMRAVSSGDLRQRLSLRQCFLNGEVLRLALYLLLLLATGVYLQMNQVVLIAGAVLVVLLAGISMRLHPREAPRSRADYVLPGVLALLVVGTVLL